MDQQDFWDDYQHLKKEATKLRGSEGRLKEIQGRYKAIAEASRDVVLVVDRELVLLDLNPAGCEILGVKPDKIGAALDEALATVSPETIRPLLKSTIESGRKQKGSWTIKRLQGPSAHLTVNVVPVVDDTNRTVGAVLLGRDLTLLRSLDQRLTEMGEEIERMRVMVKQVLS